MYSRCKTGSRYLITNLIHNYYVHVSVAHSHSASDLQCEGSKQLFCRFKCLVDERGQQRIATMVLVDKKATVN